MYWCNIMLFNSQHTQKMHSVHLGILLCKFGSAMHLFLHIDLVWIREINCTFTRQCGWAAKKNACLLGEVQLRKNHIGYCDEERTYSLLMYYMSYYCCVDKSKWTDISDLRWSEEEMLSSVILSGTYLTTEADCHTNIMIWYSIERRALLYQSAKEPSLRICFSSSRPEKAYIRTSILIFSSSHLIFPLYLLHVSYPFDPINGTTHSYHWTTLGRCPGHCVHHSTRKQTIYPPQIYR